MVTSTTIEIIRMIRIINNIHFLVTTSRLASVINSSPTHHFFLTSIIFDNHIESSVVLPPSTIKNSNRT